MSCAWPASSPPTRATGAVSASTPTHQPDSPLGTLTRGSDSIRSSPDSRCPTPAKGSRDTGVAAAVRLTRSRSTTSSHRRRARCMPSLRIRRTGVDSLTISAQQCGQRAVWGDTTACQRPQTLQRKARFGASCCRPSCSLPLPAVTFPAQLSQRACSTWDHGNDVDAPNSLNQDSMQESPLFLLLYDTDLGFRVYLLVSPFRPLICTCTVPYTDPTAPANAKRLYCVYLLNEYTQHGFFNNQQSTNTNDQLPIKNQSSSLHTSLCVL